MGHETHCCEIHHPWDPNRHCGWNICVGYVTEICRCEVHRPPDLNCCSELPRQQQPNLPCETGWSGLCADYERETPCCVTHHPHRQWCSGWGGIGHAASSMQVLM